MTSAPSAEPTTSTPGHSDFMTVGKRVIIIEWMVSGRLGAIQGHGSFEDLLEAISDLCGRHAESMQGTYRLTIRCEPELPQAPLLSSTLATSKPKTEPTKPESTSTSEPECFKQISLWEHDMTDDEKIEMLDNGIRTG